MSFAIEAFSVGLAFEMLLGPGHLFGVSPRLTAAARYS